MNGTQEADPASDHHLGGRHRQLIIGAYAASSALMLLSLLSLVTVHEFRAAAYSKALFFHLVSFTANVVLAVVIYVDDSTLRSPIMMFALTASTMAYLFWMNVMSVDIYLVFSTCSRLRQLGRVRRKFLWYSLYAWGLPLALSAGLIADLVSASVHTTLRLCSTCNPMPLFMFLLHYLPALLLSFANALLFGLTACNIYRNMRSTNVLGSQDSECHGGRVGDSSKAASQMYVKLFWMTGARESVFTVAGWFLSWFTNELLAFAALHSLAALVVFCTLCLRREVWQRLGAALAPRGNRTAPAEPPTPSPDDPSTSESQVEHSERTSSVSEATDQNN